MALEAIEFLDSDKELVESDTKINSEYSRKNHLPDIYFDFEVDDELREKLKRYAKHFEKSNKVVIVRQGNDEDDTYLDLPSGQSFQYVDAYKNVSDVEQKLQTKDGTVVTLTPTQWTATPISYQKNLKLFKEKKIQKVEDTPPPPNAEKVAGAKS